MTERIENPSSHLLQTGNEESSLRKLIGTPADANELKCKQGKLSTKTSFTYHEFSGSDLRHKADSRKIHVQLTSFLCMKL
jgi:hypothetical protein